MRKEISKDLSSLRGLLTNHWKKNITNETVLENGCKNLGNNDWEYSFGKAKGDKSTSNYLLFKNIDLGKKIRPSNLKPEYSDIKVKLGIRLLANSTKDTCNINELGVSIIISGSFLDNKEEEIAVIKSWHLDKDAPMKGNEEQKFTHAMYHLNFGGEAMIKAKEDGTQWDFGSLLLMETPRIVHHPMDAILAVDFVLRNFYYEEHHKVITKQKKYKELLYKAANRFLKPYYNGIISKWETERAIENMSCNYLLPSLNF